MGTRVLTESDVQCGMDHTPGGVACPGHTVSVAHHRSSDMVTLTIDSTEVIVTVDVFSRLRFLMNEVEG